MGVKLGEKREYNFVIFVPFNFSDDAVKIFLVTGIVREKSLNDLIYEHQRIRTYEDAVLALYDKVYVLPFIFLK